VGVRGRGSFTVADGGMVSCNYVLIGFHAIPSYDCSTTGCEGTVTVTGAGSILETTEYHYTQIGMMDGDKGSLIIENGGKVQVRALLIGWDEGSEGVVVVKNATLDVDHDILVACDSYYGSLMGKGSIRLVNGTVIASNIGIGTNGKIVGTGAITGNVFLADGGKISPGLSPGQLTIDGDLNISNGVLDLEANSPSLKDELEVSGNVTIGPEAIFNIVIGFELTDTFDIGDFFFNVLGSFTVDPAFQADQINLFFTADSGMTIGKTVEIMLGGSPFSVVAMAAPQTYVEVPIDIKPGSCPNPLNIKSKGVLPVAILGTEDFDVTDIDPASLRLAGVAPILSSIEDVSTPLLEKQDECDCISEGEDGIDDLTLKFDTQEIISALGEIADGDELVLTLTGELLDGTHIEGEDCIIILSEGKGKK
jgi:T5SS/PEP-CTERM-associated repeat protein